MTFSPRKGGGGGGGQLDKIFFKISSNQMNLSVPVVQL